MDVATRVPDVRIRQDAHLKYWQAFYFGVSLTLTLGHGLAHAQNPDLEPVTLPETTEVKRHDPMHFSAQKTIWDRKNNRVELTGKAMVNQPGDTVTADYVILDQENRVIDAKGNCVYQTPDMIMYSDEMHLDLETRTGYLIGGRVANERFSLSGSKIFKLSDTNYRTEDGTYTTCLDCPQSWVMTGDEINMELEGYAFMKSVTTRIKDAPVFWLPYLVVPMKKGRQTGILFPKFGFLNGGFTYTFPIFWAPHRSFDVTAAPGEFVGRGFRMEMQARYRLTKQSGATLNAFFLRDRTFLQDLSLPSGSEWFKYRNRYAIDLKQTQELPFGITQKLSILETSDNRYVQFLRDVPGRGESVLASDLILARSSDDVSAFVAARRFRNLLYFAEGGTTDEKASANVLFDTNTVQVAPNAVVTTRDRFLLGTPVAAGLTLGLSNFFRGAGTYDTIPPAVVSGTPPDVIREATRLSLTPSVYTTLRPFGIFSLVPQAEYRAYFYSFRRNEPNLNRGYLLLKADLSTQIERVFDTDREDVPRRKHLIRPMLSYSIIPIVNEDESHPFIKQMRFAQERSLSGFNFDNNDIVPRDTSLSNANYFIPLGHSLTYGLSTQLIERRSRVDEEWASYRRSLEFRTGQTVNFRELDKPEETRQPLSRLFASFITRSDRLETSTDYFYYPYLLLPRNQVSTSATYILKKGVNRRVYAYERSFTMSYTYNFSTQNSQTSNLRARLRYSLSDYILPSGFVSYDFVTKQMQETGLALTFQSPSQCWSFDLGFREFVCPKQSPSDTGRCINPTIDFSLNLSGDGFSTQNASRSAGASQL